MGGLGSAVLGNLADLTSVNFAIMSAERMTGQCSDSNAPKTAPGFVQTFERLSGSALPVGC